MLARRSGDADKPRILGAFNEKTPDWLSFFMFTFLTDRDGKYQLAALAESGFDPLARSTRFMLTEEAHHLFVGESGIARVLARTAGVMNEMKTEDVDAIRAAGAIDIPTIQRYLNFHFSVTLDLYGSEISSNASTFFTSGLKGRFEESKLTDDHVLTTASYPVPFVDGGRVVERPENALLALNERLRDDYIADCQAGVDRWNKILEKAGVRQRLRLPHKGFHRKIGNFAKSWITPEGEVTSEEAWKKREASWIPTDADHAFLGSLMGRVTEPGKYAGWIAPPARGIDQKPEAFEYVRFA
jgi:benzoyl-CoA 2,3-dioxygenase component B